MSVPPYVVAAVTTCASGYISDKIQKRAIVAMISSSIAVIGFALLIPVVISWGANNSGGSLKKGIAAAIIVSVGNAGGVMSSFIYPATDKPRYRKGHTICMAYNLMVFVLAGIMWLYLGSQNRKKEERNAARDHAWTAEERKELEDAGDKVDWFKYTI
jgi:hypothetical protein